MRRPIASISRKAQQLKRKKTCKYAQQIKAAKSQDPLQQKAFQP
jgi:hypothetical protein